MGHPCKRCGINFLDQSTYRAHIIESLDHNICRFCGRKEDFATFEALQRHLDDEHLYCEPCNWFAPSSLGLRQHNIWRHNMCAACGDYFVNPHELHGHASRHRPRNIHCRCCDQLFSTLSALFNHLESGACSSDIPREDIHDLVGEFFNSEPLCANSGGYLFFCHACRKPFKRMCDLLQHCETGACKEGYCLGTGRLGSLVRYILENIPSLAQQDRGEVSDRDATMVSDEENDTVVVHGSRQYPSVVISDCG